MSGQATLWDTPSATSSPGSACGAMPPDAPDGPTTAPCGAEAAPVPLSRQQAKAAGLMTLVTSGRFGTNSSASAALQSCLESRLMTRLDTGGSTLFKQTWRRRRTPLGRSYLEHIASARRTSGSGFTSWPTPQSADGTGGGQAKRAANPDRSSNLNDHVMLASWPTTTSTDAFRCGDLAQTGINVTLNHAAQSVDFGLMPSGFHAAIQRYPEALSGGQLNPEHSRWLMGLPPVFSRCVVSAMQSLRLRRKCSSARTSKRTHRA